MKRFKTLTAFALLLTLHVKAQKGIDGMIKAERSFAAHSVTHGTKDAFLHFVDSNAIMYDKGQPVNALKLWSLKEKRPGVLNWQPQFAEIAASQDFGYTAGPWTFQPKTATDSVVARGYFFTVWHLDGKGAWKFLFDIGSDQTPANTAAGVETIQAGKSSGSLENLLQVEEAFAGLSQKRPAEAYSQYLSKQSILSRENRLPAVNTDEQTQTIRLTPVNIRYTVHGSGIAPSGDLAYVYGSATLGDKTEGYLRIWRKEKEGWKLAMEALRF